MKRLIIAASALAMLAACNSNKSADTDQESVRTDSVLIKRLQQLQAEGKIAIGHHDDPAYGHRWEYCPDSSDVKNVTGDYPAIFDWDLGLIERDSAAQLDGVPFEFIREQVAKHAAAGGINTFSWHVRNPQSGGDAWDAYVGEGDSRVPVQAVEAVLNDQSVNDTMRVWLGRVADFVGSLTDASGERIPVVLRLWHENTGSWFWWGQQQCTPEQYQALWRLTRKVFDQKGIDNVVWAYSPGSEPKTEEEFLERYPGNELVDIVGFDTYYFGGQENKDRFQADVRSSLDLITTFADKHGKVAVMAETGYEGIPIDNWYTDILYPAIKDYPIAYVVFWRNSQHNPKHYYTPYAGHPAAADFVEFYGLPQTVFLKDLNTDK